MAAPGNSDVPGVRTPSAASRATRCPPASPVPPPPGPQFRSPPPPASTSNPLRAPSRHRARDRLAHRPVRSISAGWHAEQGGLERVVVADDAPMNTSELPGISVKPLPYQTAGARLGRAEPQPAGRAASSTRAARSTSPSPYTSSPARSRSSCAPARSRRSASSDGSLQAVSRRSTPSRPGRYARVSGAIVRARCRPSRSASVDSGMPWCARRRPDDAAAAALGQPGNDLVLEQLAHLARDAGQHDRPRPGAPSSQRPGAVPQRFGSTVAPAAPPPGSDCSQPAPDPAARTARPGPPRPRRRIPGAPRTARPRPSW